jgi:hypothetical protein
LTLRQPGVQRHQEMCPEPVRLITVSN